MPIKFRSTTSDSLAAKRERVRKYLSRAAAGRESNRTIAAKCRVDESMVRTWRDRLGLPKLTPGRGDPAPPPKKKRGK